jgi:hypothetical protein
MNLFFTSFGGFRALPSGKNNLSNFSSGRKSKSGGTAIEKFSKSPFRITSLEDCSYEFLAEGTVAQILKGVLLGKTCGDERGYWISTIIFEKLLVGRADFAVVDGDATASGFFGQGGLTGPGCCCLLSKSKFTTE